MLGTCAGWVSKLNNTIVPNQYYCYDGLSGTDLHWTAGQPLNIPHQKVWITGAVIPTPAQNTTLATIRIYDGTGGLQETLEVYIPAGKDWAKWNYEDHFGTSCDHTLTLYASGNGPLPNDAMPGGGVRG